MLKFERIEPPEFGSRSGGGAETRQTLAVGVVVPVLLHRQRERGCNQANLITKLVERFC